MATCKKTLLFLCPIFPTQFKAVVNAFAPTHKIVAACHKNNSSQIRGTFDNITVLHELPFGGFENNLVVFGNGLIQLLDMLKRSGDMPDIVFVQASFGFEMLLGLLPQSVPVIGYFELWYPDSITKAVGADARRTMSAVHTNAIQAVLADRSAICVTPSRYQRSQFPLNIRKKMFVLHEGIDTDYFKPKAPTNQATRKLITFVSTGLEPGKCFIQFIEIVCLVMQQRADVDVEIVGNDVVL
jgi:glycosyltransferase involved in cell wall biosynthesis